jgi:hypothetical protein
MLSRRLLRSDCGQRFFLKQYDWPRIWGGVDWVYFANSYKIVVGKINSSTTHHLTFNFVASIEVTRWSLHGGEKSMCFC